MELRKTSQSSTLSSPMSTHLLKPSQGCSDTCVELSLRDFVLTNSRYYHFFCFMGMLYPRHDDMQQKSFTTYNFRYRFWYLVMYSMFAVSTALYFFYGVIIYVEGWDTDPVLDFCATFGIFIQSLLLVPVVMRVNQNFEMKQRITDTSEFAECMNVAVPLGYRVCWVVIAMEVVLVVLQILVVGLDTASSIVSLVLIAVFNLGLYLIPCGALAVLVVEQQQSLFAVRRVYQAARLRSLLPTQYLSERHDVLVRRSTSVLHRMLFSAVINTLIGMVSIVTLLTSEVSRSIRAVYILYVCCVFGKQLLILGVLLLQMSKVNEAAVEVMNAIAVPGPLPEETEHEEEAISGEGATAIPQPATCSEELPKQAAAATVGGAAVKGKNETETLTDTGVPVYCEWGTVAMEQRRLALYVLLRQRKLGSSILGFRPTHVELLSMALSSCVAIVVAIFWAFVFA